MLLLTLTQIIFAAEASVESYQKLFNDIGFEEALQMRQGNRALNDILAPINAIKAQCGLNDDDVWPLKEINVYGNLNENCLQLLDENSHYYQSATLTVPTDSSVLYRTIKTLKAKRLTLNFPNNSGGSLVFPNQHDSYKNINTIQIINIFKRLSLYNYKSIAIRMK